MRRRQLWGAVLCFAVCDAVYAEEQSTRKTAEAVLADQPAELVAALRERKVVMLQELPGTEGEGGDLIVGFVLFQGAREPVYSLLAQTSRQIEYRPEIRSIETLHWEATGPIDAHTIRIVFSRFVYHLRWHLDPEARRLRWELDSSRENDLEQLTGSWELFELAEGGTLGRFTTSVNVGRAVPRFLQDYITRRNLPETMENNRRWVDSDGTYRP